MSQVATHARVVEDARTSHRVGVSPVAAALLGLTLVAFILRLVGLDRESLWLDEGYTLLFSGFPLGKLMAVGGAHEHPPLYYLTVHAALRIWPSYLVPRAVAAVAGALSVPVIYALGVRLHSSLAGLVAAVCVTLSPFHVWYSRDGRAYELAGLWVLLSYLTLLVASTDGSWRRWGLYVVTTLLAMYTEYTTVFVLLPQVLFLLRARRCLLASWLLVAIGYLPWIGVLLRDTSAVAGDYWIPAPGVSDVVTTALEFLGLVTPCPSPPCTGHPVAFAGSYGAVLVLLAGLMILGGGVWVGQRMAFPTLVLVAWLVVPFLIVIPLSMVRSLYLDRVFLDATFALYLLIGVICARAIRLPAARLVALPLLGLLLLGNAVGTGLVYGDKANPDWRSLARDLQSAYRPGQAVFFNPGVLRTLVSSYLPKGWHATRERALWSRSYLDVPGWQRYYPDAKKSDLASRTRTESILRDRQLADVTRGVEATWLVTYDYPGLSDTRRWFTSHGFRPLVSELYDGDTRLELWSRKDPSSLGPPVTPPLGRWHALGRTYPIHGGAQLSGPSSLSTSFPLTAGRAYSARMEYRGAPPSGPEVSIWVFDRQGRQLGVYPRTMWYELPVTGVWLDQPFGFVAPPGAARATIQLENHWGQVSFRQVGVFASP